jgi:hypothetical protein
MLGPFMCPLGRVLGPCDPAASDIVFQQELQIVRSALVHTVSCRNSAKLRSA